MISAQPETPFHLVQVNAKHRAEAPYIVAAQCTMLLVTWSDPAKVPALSLRPDKADYWTGKWAKSKALSSLGPSALDIASIWIRGLANQLFSAPLEIRAARTLGRLPNGGRRVPVRCFGITRRHAGREIWRTGPKCPCSLLPSAVCSRRNGR